MRKQFEDSLCSVPQIFYLTLKTIKSHYGVIFLIFCVVFLCTFFIVKPINDTLDYCTKNDVLGKISTTVSALKNKSNLKNAAEMLKSYTDLSDIDVGSLNDYLNSHQKDGQFDEKSLKKLINSNLNNGKISSDDLNKLLQSDSNKTTSKKTTQDKNPVIKDTKLKISYIIKPFIALVFASMCFIMIGYIVGCYTYEEEVSFGKMIELSFKNIFQTFLFYSFIILTLSLLLFFLDTFVKGNLMFFNIMFTILMVAICLVIILFLITLARLVFVLPIIGLFEFDFLRAFSESLYVTKRLTLNTILDSFFCTFLCFATYISTYLLFSKTNSSFLFGFVLTVLFIFSALYHSVIAINISCLFNPSQYAFDEIVNDYSHYEPEKAESLWSHDLEVSNFNDLNSIDSKQYKDKEEVYVNLSILKDDIDAVNKKQPNNKFIG